MKPLSKQVPFPLLHAGLCPHASMLHVCCCHTQDPALVRCGLFVCLWLCCLGFVFAQCHPFLPAHLYAQVNTQTDPCKHALNTPTDAHAHIHDHTHTVEIEPPSQPRAKRTPKPEQKQKSRVLDFITNKHRGGVKGQLQDSEEDSRCVCVRDCVDCVCV